MAFDGITVSALASQLKKRLAGGYISKIAGPDKDQLMLTVKVPEGGQTRLLISVGASLPFLYLTEHNRTSPATAPAFVMLLRKYLQGGRICDVRQPSFERIIRIEIEHRDELGDLCIRTLLVELMGKHSNIIFVDGKDEIIDSIKRIPLTVSSVREVLPGRPYFIPNTGEKRDPSVPISKEEFEELVFRKNGSVCKALYGTFTGFSPSAASELLYRAGIDSDDDVSAVEQPLREKLYESFTGLMDQIRKEEFRPCIIYDGDKPVDLCACEPMQQQDLKIRYFDSISEVLERFYAEKDLYTRIRQHSADLRKTVSNAIDRTAKKLDIQRKQLADTKKMDKYRVYGELINTYGYEVADGSDSFEAVNFYTGETVQVPLDPLFSVHENANRYFERYQKLKRTRDAVGKQIEETEMALQHLQSIQNSLNIASDEADLKQIAGELAETGYMKRKTSMKKEKAVSRPLHYVSTDGFDIYVGKNNYQNDELTFRLSEGTDWWFHSKKYPGSHVLLRTNGLNAEEIPDRAFNEAGKLAAYYSSARQQDKVEIDYTQKKNVKKPSGAVPGFVVYYTNYSMTIDSDIRGLKLIERE